ncbi:MAG: SprT-like domain-containing protein [Erysipelotrichales bacterium]|nr:SprT-like domain-containing protein [Erysipelotrichales bacterium]
MKSLRKFIEHSLNSLSLDKYIIEQRELFEAQSKVTIEWMKEHYEKYNKELFDNRLPKTIEFTIINDRKNTFLGYQSFKKQWFYRKDRLVGSKYKVFVNDTVERNDEKIGSLRVSGWAKKLREVDDISELEPVISMNNRYDYSDFQKEDTLIHEMVHLENYVGGVAPKRAHGADFRKECNRVRALAKKLYGIEYDLQTYAQDHDEEDKSYTDNYTNEIKKDIKADLEKEVSRGGGIYPILIEYDKRKMPGDTLPQIQMMKFDKRFVCCTKWKLESILEQIKRSKGVEHIWVGDPEVMKNIIKDYGKFSTCNKYARFWNANEYPKVIDHIKKDGKDILNINEGLGSWFKKIIDKIMSVFIGIKGGTPLDNVDFEEIADYAEEIENSESEEIKGSAENDKKLIEIDKE